MEFATQIDFINALGADAFNLVGLPVGSDLSQSAPLAVSLQEANGIADGYLRGRYGNNLPLTSHHPEITGFVVNIARYKLINRVRRDKLLQTDKDGYDEAMSYFRDIQSGKVVLSTPNVNAAELNSQLTQPMVGGSVIQISKTGGSSAEWFSSL